MRRLITIDNQNRAFVRIYTVVAREEVLLQKLIINQSSCNYIYYLVYMHRYCIQCHNVYIPQMLAAFAELI